MFESIIGEADSKFELGNDKAGNLLAAILDFIRRDGFSGFFARFENVGLGDLASSWIGTNANTPISNEQTGSAFGENTLKSFADKTGLDYKTATSATAFMIPHIVDQLTLSGKMPKDTDISAMLGGSLPAANASGMVAGETFDRMDASVSSSAVDLYDDEDPKDENPILSWLLPLIILIILIILGFWFCGKSTPIVTNINTNANTASNTTKVDADANKTTTANAVDSSFKIEAKDGKYVVSGIVPDQTTFDNIKAKLNAEFGAGNVDFSGLKVDAAAKPFAANWWTNFEKMLPSLKGWKTGVLAFAGNTITEASDLPSAALDQLKSLFAGWTMPSSMNGGATAATDENRQLSEVALPDGTKLQAYPNGIEDQLIKFIESDEYKNGNADTLEDKWFNFDDLNFKFGTTELAPESKRQLDNIVAILKAFPDAKIKIGGYTDKKGDDTANKKLSENRAKAVKTALDGAGVGAQVPEVEGYGEEFSTLPETATDEERKVDRKTAVRLIK